jgi:two-component system response regulator PilR (NtrC family)
MSKGRLLIIDDDLSVRQFLTNMLRRDGYSVKAASGGVEALALMKKGAVEVVVTDLMMDGMSGMEVLKAVKEGWPDTEVVMITAHATTENAVQAMKNGAYDYVTKPFNIDELKLILGKAFEKRAIHDENVELKRAIADRHGYANLVGRDEAMLKMYDLMERVKDTPVTILITGESGTGKELVAKAIHYEGQRKAKPFRSINCGAIPETLIESELFGYRKGAFTGAVRDQQGLFVSAEGGTLFLDEVGEMPLATQVKLLRVLQDRRVKPLGGVEEQELDVRIIAATNRDLGEEVRQGRFREDLYYRLNVISVAIPPLRDRISDLPLLIQHFLDQYTKQFSRGPMRLSKEAALLLSSYQWPGNVREVENVIQRCVALSRSDDVGTDTLPPEIRHGAEGEGNGLQLAVGPEGADLEQLVEHYERTLLESALSRAGGVKTEAARLLGISFRSLRYRLHKIGIEEGSGRPDDGITED